MNRLALLLAAALLSGAPAPAAAQDEVPYTPPSKAFSCTLPMGWTAYEQATPVGTVAHIVGPETAAGWRPAYHIHVVEKGKPGWRPGRETLKALRRSEDAAERTVTGLNSWRVARKPARLFEAREVRMYPPGKLPAELLPLHHFYAYVPSVGEDYLVVKLTTREAEYLDYRKEFTRFLESLRVLGY